MNASMTTGKETAVDPHLDEILPFKGGGSFPVQYELIIDEAGYYVRYRSGWLSIDKNGVEVFEQCLNAADEYDGEWSDEETTVYLYLIGKAIEAGDFDGLALPDKEAAKSHPLYMPGPQPAYVFIDCEEDHEHSYAVCPTVTITAMDLARMRAEREASMTFPQRVVRMFKRLIR